ncbi:MAG: hypothetical protein WCV62_03280 [Candidatus Peribacteraceae bacterium]|jgi:hypothetical protein
MADNAVKEWGGWDAYLEEEEERARQALAQKAKTAQPSPMVSGVQSVTHEYQKLLFSDRGTETGTQ